jgi:carboxyl-terminal processing protease
MFVSTLNKSGYSESNDCHYWRTLTIMMRKFHALWALAWLGFSAALPAGVSTASGQTADGPATNAVAVDTQSTNALRLAPGPNDGRIAYWTARLLQDHHYSQRRFDAEVSEQFFDRYFEALDPQHIHFLQSDVAEFDRYRTNLDTLTLTTNHVADTTPAYEIFSRFLERLEQRIHYSTNLLNGGKFEFNTDEKILINRRKAPYPADLAEARELWRQRLRYDYLEEELSRVATKKKDDAAAKAGLLEKPGTTPPKPADAAKGVKPKTDAEEIADMLTRRYHRNLRLFQEWDYTDVLEVYLTALARVYDPHSEYLNASQSENFSINMSLSLFGIGALLTTDLDGYCKIMEVKPGPAMKSKQLKAEDRIVAVAQSNQPPVNVENMKLNNVVQMIRGPKGTEVRLTIMPAGSSERKVVSLIRDEIKLEEGQAKATIVEMPGGGGKNLRLGVIALPSFYTPFDLSNGRGRTEPHSPTADIAKLLKKFNQENVDGVILDLRRNGGGSLPEAITLTSLFIKGGPVVQVGEPDGAVEADGDRDPVMHYDGPLIVLTSRFTASASEILVGALQDYGRALIVGDISTHGKGTVQSVTPLQRIRALSDLSGTNDPGSLKMTMHKFYRPSGVSTQSKGVMPDIVLPSVWNYSTDVGERALDNALPPGEPIKSAGFDRLDRVGPFLGELLKRSSDRVATNRDFAYVREDIELFEKVQADKTISLNEKQRLKEREEAIARQEARDKEFAARNEPGEKVYVLTLDKVDQPGLPPPVAKTNSAVAKAAGIKGVSSAAASTNSAAVSATVPETAGNPDDDTGEKWTSDAATLDETERILADYISMLRQKSLMTANH